MMKYFNTEKWNALATGLFMLTLVAFSPIFSGSAEARVTVNVQEKAHSGWGARNTVVGLSVVEVTASSVTISFYQMIHIQNNDTSGDIFCSSDTAVTAGSGFKVAAETDWYVAVSSPLAVFCISDVDGIDVRVASFR